MAYSDCGWTCGCAGKTEIPWEHVPYLSASAVVIHYEEALYQVYGSTLTLTLFQGRCIQSHNSVTMQWCNTGRRPASRSYADLFIYLGLNATAHTQMIVLLRFDCDSTAVRLPFDWSSTALRPFDDIR